MRRVFPILFLAFLAGCTSQTGGDEVWATVNGRPIYRRLVEARFTREVSEIRAPLTEGEASARKLNILNELVQQEILIQKAAEAGVTATEQEIGDRIARRTGPLTEQEFQLRMKDDGTTLADLSDQFRREISIRKLLDQVTADSLEISEAAMQEYYDANKSEFHLVEPQFHVAVILVTPRADREIRNLGNNDARTGADAQRKVRTLIGRLRAGEDFEELARQYSEHPVTALSGGDLGFFPESALQASHPSLRAAVRRLQTGQWAGPVTSPEGTYLVKLLEYEPAGQRLLTEPTIRASVEERLRKIRRLLLEEAFIERARNQARVENYLARQILDTHRPAP